jgi:ABC-type bacteriocin/lantibiotic exporter with double-glycine peptidase domain
MIMRYWSRQDGRRVPPEAEVSAIQAALYSRKDRGISNTAMRRYLGTNGFRTFAYRGDWNDLAHEIALGRPLIIAMAPERAGASLHYVVVVGVDRDANFVFVNDPAQGKLLRISREVFESQWKAVDNWTLLALPPPSK